MPLATRAKNRAKGDNLSSRPRTEMALIMLGILDLLFQSWAAAAHLPQVLGHQWRGYVHHTLDPRFVLLRTTPTPPPLPRRRHPGAFLRHGRVDFRVWRFLKKTEIPRRFLKKTAIPIIKMGNSADLEIALPLLRRRGHFYIGGGYYVTVVGHMYSPFQIYINN